VIDTTNKFLVACRGECVSILLPPLDSISADDALVLAAYLVSMAEHDATHPFADVLAAVQNT
jgi:hypothetical protein